MNPLHPLQRQPHNIMKKQQERGGVSTRSKHASSSSLWPVAAPACAIVLGDGDEVGTYASRRGARPGGAQ